MTRFTLYLISFRLSIVVFETDRTTVRTKHKIRMYKLKLLHACFVLLYYVMIFIKWNTHFISFRFSFLIFIFNRRSNAKVKHRACQYLLPKCMYIKRLWLWGAINQLKAMSLFLTDFYISLDYNPRKRTK